MINRQIYSKLESWHANEHNAMLITGARQIGKTFTIRHFAKQNFKYFVEINFIESPNILDIFMGVSSSEDLLLRLATVVNVPLVKGETLIFFDEVQECKEIVTAIKFLVEEGSYRYIMSGSLLGVELKDIRSVPVGYMHVEQMYPLNFREFIEALNVQPTTIEHLRNSWINEQPVDPIVHNKMLQLFRLYMIVGGMPAVVSKYLETNNLQLVLSEQLYILSLYKMDIAKYDPNNKLYLNEIFDLIAAELNAKNKRFVLKQLNENIKFSRYENSFLWLKDAGVALPTYNVDEPQIPLMLSKSRNLFKLFKSDIGLLTCDYGRDIQRELISSDCTANFGSVYENVVAQELTSQGYKLYYYNSKKYGELDFVIEHNGEVLPIEVKSGKDYERHRALNNVLDCENYHINRALVLCNDNIKRVGKVLYLPIYLLMFLKSENTDSLIYKIDLQGL